MRLTKTDHIIGAWADPAPTKSGHVQTVTVIVRDGNRHIHEKTLIEGDKYFTARVWEALGVSMAANAQMVAAIRAAQLAKGQK